MFRFLYFSLNEICRWDEYRWYEQKTGIWHKDFPERHNGLSTHAHYKKWRDARWYFEILTENGVDCTLLRWVTIFGKRTCYEWQSKDQSWFGSLQTADKGE